MLKPAFDGIGVIHELAADPLDLAEPGMSLVEADYSAIEMRILAVLSGDETMLSIFKKGLYLWGAERAQREDPTLQGGDESGALPHFSRNL
ncbi:DNA polymerase [Candidatus Methanocrinis natronophilus]|uniref:DNA polymerase n=1 Tax=Candidatus Methanocrinis natronophilus TaxID=3033396 RepID=A0ABT5XBF2_9EURY|nr:DNA polymerase [Candidatus Methanocrinis natronophilus]MDF0591867.1 DNA polymerase [Candidatus Methanocrinis natronophilus]